MPSGCGGIGGQSSIVGPGLLVRAFGGGGGGIVTPPPIHPCVHTPGSSKPRKVGFFMHVADPGSPGVNSFRARERGVALEELNPSWFSLLEGYVLPRPKRDLIGTLGPLTAQKLNNEEVRMHACSR